MGDPEIQRLIDEIISHEGETEVDLHSIAGEVGVSWRTVYRWSRGESQPTSQAHIERLEALHRRMENPGPDAGEMSQAELVLGIIAQCEVLAVLSEQAELDEVNEEMIAQMRKIIAEQTGKTEEEIAEETRSLKSAADYKRVLLECKLGCRLEEPARLDWKPGMGRLGIDPVMAAEIEPEEPPSRAEVLDRIEVLAKRLPTGFRMAMSTRYLWFSHGILLGVGDSIQAAKENAQLVADLVDEDKSDVPDVGDGNAVLIIGLPVEQDAYWDFAGPTASLMTRGLRLRSDGDDLDLRLAAWYADRERLHREGEAMQLERSKELYPSAPFDPVQALVKSDSLQAIMELKIASERMGAWRVSGDPEFDLAQHTLYLPIAAYNGNSWTLRITYTVEHEAHVTNRHLSLQAIEPDNQMAMPPGSVWPETIASLLGLTAHKLEDTIQGGITIKWLRDHGHLEPGLFTPYGQALPFTFSSEFWHEGKTLDWFEPLEPTEPTQTTLQAPDTAPETPAERTPGSGPSD